MSSIEPPASIPPSYDRLGRQVGGVFRKWRRHLDDVFRPSGFTQSIRAPLILLYDHGEPLQQKEMALRLGLEASALVRVVRILSERGLICWQKEPHDKRAKSIELTDAGRVTCEMILAESNKIERYLLEDISAEDLQTFREVLAKISSRLPDS